MNNLTYKPSNIVIQNDEANREFIGTALTFYVTGTWLVEIDGLRILPGGSLNESLEDQNIKHNYQIKFLLDLSSHAICTNNPSLRAGKHLIARILKQS